jgi:hypothetical protein
VLLTLLVAALAAALPASTDLSSIDPLAAPGALAPFLAVSGGELLATWIEPDGASGQRVRLARSRNGGAAWHAPVTVAGGTGLFANWADTPGVVAAGDGALLVWWLEKSGGGTYAYDARLARSTDGGATFRALGKLNDDATEAEHGFVSAVAEGRGARFFYLDGRHAATGGATQLRSVPVAGDRIGASELLDDSVCDCCPTSAVALPEGEVGVAFRDREPGEIRDVRFLRLRDGRPQGPGALAGNDRWVMPGCPVNGPSLAASGQRLALAWFAAPAQRPRVAVTISRDGGRTLESPIPLDPRAPLGRVAATALADGGFAVAWFASAGEGGAELRVARIDPGSGRGAEIAVARTAAGRASGTPRLAALGARLALAWSEPEPAPARIRVATLPVAALPRPVPDR